MTDVVGESLEILLMRIAILAACLLKADARRDEATAAARPGDGDSRIGGLLFSRSNRRLSDDQAWRTRKCKSRAHESREVQPTATLNSLP